MTHESDFEKPREMIKEIDLCMLTTVDEDDDLHSRPMSLNSQVDGPDPPDVALLKVALP